MLTSDPNLTILQIWERLIDDHEAAIAYPCAVPKLAHWL